MSAADEPNQVELEAAITLHASQAARYGRYWREYDWTHQQINELLDQREQQMERDRRSIAAKVKELFGPRP